MLRLALFCSVAMGFFIPIAPAPAYLFYTLAIVFAVCSRECRARLIVYARHPAVLAMWGLYAACLLGALHGVGDWATYSRYLGKYSKWLFIPVLASIFTSDKERMWPIFAFTAAMALTLLLSIVIGLGHQDWIGFIHFDGDRSGNPFVFKQHITQSLFMAFAAFFALHQGWTKRQKRVFSSAWFVFGLLALFNVFVMMEGRTGWLVCLILCAFAFWRFFRFKGLVVGVVSSLVFAVAGYSLSSNLHERTDKAIVEIQTWKPALDQAAEGSSMGMRLNYWYYASRIIREHPIFGVGIGGYEAAFVEQTKGTPVPANNNPHEQYLLFAAQLGLVGLLIFLASQLVLWWVSLQAKSPLGVYAQGLLIGFAGGNLFNSFFLDSAESLLFAGGIALLLVSTYPSRRVKTHLA